MTNILNIEIMDNITDLSDYGLSLNENSILGYEAFGTVITSIGDCRYLVRLQDGSDIQAISKRDHIVENGTNVGLISLSSRLIMIKLEPK